MGIAADLDPGDGGAAGGEAADYQRAKMALAVEGLPASAQDAEAVLGQLQLGSSRSVEAMRLKQAQEVELAQSIALISGITGVRVHLALPERTAFIRDSQPPRASVVVTLRAGQVLSAGQVEAITNLVASSVPGLARDLVSVIDHRGRLLSLPEGDDMAALGSRQMMARRQMEDLYRSRIEALLIPLTGAGNLSVQVALDMDFTQAEIQESRVMPDAAAILSEETQSSESTAPQARGIPGLVSNTPPAPATPSAAANQAEAGQPPAAPTNQTASAKRTFEIGRRVETTRTGAPTITRLSVAVLLRAPEGGEAVPLQDMERLVKGAIGFDATRGDSVTLLAQPFREEELPPETAPAAVAGGIPQMAILAAIAAVVVLAALTLLVVQLRRKPAPAAAVPQAPAEIGSDPAAMALPAPAEMEQQRREERRLNLARSALNSGSRDEKHAILRQIAEEDPARIAAVLRKMMKDEIDRVM
ncbi:MAG: flagellar basal-body MS-ring/collar protein FliF [Gemmobacter sp.]|nr:flagellar basal-body MS-ring/collar protein FliF [Gemmobacter sp.]